MNQNAPFANEGLPSTKANASLDAEENAAQPLENTIESGAKNTATIQKLRPLTKKQKIYANEYLNTGNGTEAALEAYDTDNPKTAAVISSQNLGKLNIQQYLADKAEDAVSTIYDLSQNATLEPVRLNASKDILDRAGYKPVDRVQTTNIQINIENKHYLEQVAAKVIEDVKATEENNI